MRIPNAGSTTKSSPTFFKTLKVNEDSRQQELAMKIMMACPELVAG
jgi:hypothetical protein